MCYPNRAIGFVHVAVGIGVAQVAGHDLLAERIPPHAEVGRVDRAVAAIDKGDKQALLSIITESGNSSWKWLQNAFVAGSAAEEPIPLALAMSEIFLSRIGAGACRLHGGGFAGVIMCVLPKDETAAYVDFMSPVFGRENVYRMGTRQTGVVCLGA